MLIFKKVTGGMLLFIMQKIILKGFSLRDIIYFNKTKQVKQYIDICKVGGLLKIRNIILNLTSYTILFRTAYIAKPTTFLTCNFLYRLLL